MSHSVIHDMIIALREIYVSQCHTRYDNGSKGDISLTVSYTI